MGDSLRDDEIKRIKEAKTPGRLSIIRGSTKAERLVKGMESGKVPGRAMQLKSSDSLGSTRKSRVISRQEVENNISQNNKKGISIDEINERSTFKVSKPVRINDGFKKERFKALIVIYLVSLGVVLWCIGMEASRFKIYDLNSKYSTAEGNRLNVRIKGGLYAGAVNNLLKTSWYLDDRLVGQKSSQYTYSIQGIGKHTLTMVRGSKIIKKEIEIYKDTNTADETGRYLSMCGAHTSEYNNIKDTDGDGIADKDEDKLGLQKFNNRTDGSLLDITTLMVRNKSGVIVGDDGGIEVVKECGDAKIKVKGSGNVPYTFIEKSIYEDELQRAGYTISGVYSVFSEGMFNGIGDAEIADIKSIELHIRYDSETIDSKDISVYKYDENNNSISLVSTKFNRGEAIANIRNQGVYFLGKVGDVPIQKGVDVVYLVENTYETVNNKYIEDRDKLLSGIQKILSQQSSISSLRSGIITFQSRANIVNDVNVSTDADELITNLENLRNICNTSNTVNWKDSLYEVVRDMDSLPDSDSKYVILVTNELTRGIRANIKLRALINRMNANNIKVIALGISKYNSEIKRVAEETGGYYLYTTSMNHVDDYTNAIASSIDGIVYRSKRYKKDEGYRVIASSFLKKNRVMQFNCYQTNKYKNGNSLNIMKLVKDINTGRQTELNGKSIYAYTYTYNLKNSLKDINYADRIDYGYKRKGINELDIEPSNMEINLFSMSKLDCGNGLSKVGYYLDVINNTSDIREKYGAHDAYMLNLLNNMDTNVKAIGNEGDLIYDMVMAIRRGEIVTLQLDGECGTHCVAVKNIYKKQGFDGIYSIEVYDNFDYNGNNYIKVIEIPRYDSETNSVINGYSINYEVKGIRFNRVEICEIR